MTIFFHNWQRPIPQPSSCPAGNHLPPHGSSHSVLSSFDPLRQHGNALAQATAAPPAAGMQSCLTWKFHGHWIW